MSSLLDMLFGADQREVVGEDRPLRAYVWARTSTDMQERRGLSIPEQLREIRAYAERHGIEIIEEFTEAASASQRKAHRDEFQEVVKEGTNEEKREFSRCFVQDSKLELASREVTITFKGMPAKFAIAQGAGAVFHP